jgi:putative drug exporter of the RND superfamily
VRKLGRFAARRSVWVLSAWAVVFVVALLTASNARQQIHETDLRIPGSDSARAADLTETQFGSTIALAVLLIGPQQTVEREGPRIVRQLGRIDGVEVLSPWDRNGRRVVTEQPGQALLTLQVRKSLRQIFDDTTPAVQRVLARYRGRDGLRVELTGQAPLMRAINDVALDALDKGELIALPILIVMLLAIFRSPIAALVPAISGLLVTRLGTALMGLIGRGIEIDALALNLVAMIGLALGVDYSLLVVSRFREELANGRGVPEAVEEVTARAGRTVLFAGSALAIGMLTALALAPGALLVSSSLGLLVATIVAVCVALLMMPSLLMVLGTNVNRWQFGGARGASPWVAIAERALRRPGAAAFFVALPLLLISVPALGLNTGAPNLANLPPDNPARESFERFQSLRGAGFAAPFEVDFRTRGPITTTERLRAIDAFQERVSRLPGVESVLGPAVLLDRARQLRSLTTQALGFGRLLTRLQNGLRGASDGTSTLRDGLAAGANGASQLVVGIDELAGGAGQLAAGAKRAAPATHRLAGGVAQASSGASRLHGALVRARPDVQKLVKNVNVLSDSLNEARRTAGARLFDPLNAASSKMTDALRSLGSANSANPVVASDPNVQRALRATVDALTQLNTVQGNLSSAATTQTANAIAARQLAKGTVRLQRALGQLEDGTGRLADGLGRASNGARRLAAGTGRLSSGLDQLDAGTHVLLDGPSGNDGARALADGLQAAVGGTTRLGRGMQRILGGVVRVRARADGQQAALRRGGTDVSRAIGSGYFVLAALQGADPQIQANTGFVTNVADGGGTARVVVIGSAGPFDGASVDLAKLLRRETAITARQLGATTAVVGGPAVLLDDFDTNTTARFPYLVAALVLITFLVLLVLFRSPVLALCAVLLNLVTVGAAVGVLVICFQGDAPLLGGPGYLDAIALSGLFAIVFGLSIDYEVFLITRLLEGRERTGTTEGAIHYGLEKTGTIITGAAFIMAAVFLSFAASPVSNIRQFGIGLTVAVLLDATIVRLILLPALIRLFGERTWHVPAWLDRILPRIASH